MQHKGFYCFTIFFRFPVASSIPESFSRLEAIQILSSLLPCSMAYMTSFSFYTKV